MGPGGELRYPSCPTEKLNQPGSSSELGEFQCYDKVHCEMRFLLLNHFKMEYWWWGGVILDDQFQGSLAYSGNWIMQCVWLFVTST